MRKNRGDTIHDNVEEQHEVPLSEVRIVQLRTTEVKPGQNRC